LGRDEPIGWWKRANNPGMFDLMLSTLVSSIRPKVTRAVSERALIL